MQINFKNFEPNSFLIDQYGPIQKKISRKWPNTQKFLATPLYVW